MRAHIRTHKQNCVTSQQTHTFKKVQSWQQLHRDSRNLALSLSHTHSTITDVWQRSQISRTCRSFLTCRERRATKQPLVKSDGCSRKKCESWPSPESGSSGKTGPLTLEKPRETVHMTLLFSSQPSTRQHWNCCA